MTTVVEELAEPNIGDAVIYIDQFGKEHMALVCQVWNRTNYQLPASYGNMPGLNLVYVSDNEAEVDQYGRQIRREATSVVHESAQPAHGRKWRHLNDSLPPQ